MQESLPEKSAEAMLSKRRPAWQYRLVLWVVVAASVSAFFLLRWHYRTTWPRSAPRSGYRHVAEQHAERIRKAKDPRVLFFGDSITEGWYYNGGQVWKDRYVPQRAINLGAWADKTQHLLWRMRQLPLDEIEPELVILLIGTNNREVDPPHRIAKGVEASVRYLKKELPSAEILLLGIFPVDFKPTETRAKVAEVNDMLRVFAAEEGIHYLDLWDRFILPDGTIPYQHMYDYLHLTEQGYEIWYEGMEPTIRAILGEPALTSAPDADFSSPIVGDDSIASRDGATTASQSSGVSR